MNRLTQRKPSAYSMAGSRRQTAPQSGRPLSAASTTFRTPQQSVSRRLRSYMLPWFSPFAAPWCGKIQRAFPKAYVTMNFELILVPRTNTYINLNHCSTPDEFKAEVIECIAVCVQGVHKAAVQGASRRHQQAARHQIHAGGHGVHLHQPRQRHQPRAVHEVCQERV